MKVLVGCEFSGIVRDEFLKLGHSAVSCDILPSESPGPHYQGNLESFLSLRNDWDLIIAHPPCTFLTNAGVRWLHDHVKSKNGKSPEISGKIRWKYMEEAASFFNFIKNFPCKRICIENPVPHKYAVEKIGKYSQIIQPWQFGHGETKKTCLWLKGLPLLKPTKIVEGRYARIHLMSPGPERSKERSRTYKGIAEAMAKQWGGGI